MNETRLDPFPRLSKDARAVARAMALQWSFRSASSNMKLLRELGATNAAGRPFGVDGVKIARQDLRRAGLVLDRGNDSGYLRLRDDVRAAVYRQLLDDTKAAELLRALLRAEVPDPGLRFYGFGNWDPAATVAIVRLEFLSGATTTRINDLRDRAAVGHDWGDVLREAVLEPFDAELFDRISPDWRFGLAAYGLAELCSTWRPAALPLRDWALRRLEIEGKDLREGLRIQIAEMLLYQGDVARAADVLAGIKGGAAEALRAAAKVVEGRFAEAQPEFESAFKTLQVEHGARRGLLPMRVAWLYSLALLAQQTPQALALAKKFCLRESGRKNPLPYEPWGAWTHVISARLGDVSFDPDALRLQSRPNHLVCWGDLWRSLLRAWLGAETVGDEGKERDERAAMVSLLRERLSVCGFVWLDRQIEAAERVFSGGKAPEHFFVAGAQENWRAVLVSLQALGGDTPPVAEGRATRILWAVSVDKQGALEDIVAMEQKRGVRSWNQPKPVPLARLVKNQKLGPEDVRVARAIRSDRHATSRLRLDLPAAIAALVGHPLVVISDALETMVDVVEGTPELEVTRNDDGFVVQVTPPMREHSGRGEPFYLEESDRRERLALRSITVLRDSPQRIRVIRLTDAQRRAAKLVSGRFSVPLAGHSELQLALRSLSGHFHIHSDDVEGAIEVEAESRLRAELTPSGDGIALRLVVAPLGPDGPRLMPGSGRARVMASMKGEAQTAQRDLETERAHLDSVLAAFDFLDPPERGDISCEWVIEEPERALATIEALPKLTAVQSIDWPRGKSVRVITVDAARMALRVATERDWFKVEGEARLDEGRVFELEALLAAASGKSRFVPMGQGLYAALTKELREKLVELKAVSEAHAGELRVPHLALGWLDTVLEGLGAETDRAFAGKIKALRAAQATHPKPPSIAAELRPYQEDGYAWAIRLAHSGFGACLADDMGLGKTIQALAVLVARADEGPALVIAPTSVCGNWLAETQRFAPTLNAVIYGDGESDRAATIESAGPRDVVIVSYTLMLQAKDVFAKRVWRTLVVDEAQAIKNASAKRSLAVFDLQADFRLALSGTPIENRLGDLWSIMRFCNPGLLGTVARFNERFAAPIERERDRDAQRILRRLIAPFVLRRTKSEVLQELPPRTELVLSISPEPDEAAHYEALRRQALKESEQAVTTAPKGQAGFHILAQLTRLRRAACDPRLQSPHLGIVGAKVRAFAELASELVANGHKALVFSQFVDFLTLLRAPLDEAKIPYQYLDGATPAAERTKRVAAFQRGEGDLFLISLKAGGYGLNLTAADYVVIADPWWNPAAEDQAMGRAHRMGQARPVTVYRLVSKGTLEEQIVKLHHDKRALAEGVLAENAEGKVVPTPEELIALMRH
ncbi:MAG: DEAD/DEAH box helicase [Vicinamibacteria bacterium]